MRLTIRGIAGFVLAVLALSPSAGAQDWSWPEKPQNLQVFPEDWPGSRLRAPMIGFTRALGVRCSHCHVGEEGKPLGTYDFASDDNPVWDSLGEAYLKAGDTEAAERHYAKSLELDPANQNAAEVLEKIRGGEAD